MVDQNLAASAGKQLRCDINHKELNWFVDMNSYCVDARVFASVKHLKQIMSLHCAIVYKTQILVEEKK